MRTTQVIQPVFIVGADRSPMTKKSKPAQAWYQPWTKKAGKLSGVHPVDLGVAVVDALVLRAGLKNRAAVEEVSFGCATPTGEQGFNVGKNIASIALGKNVPASTVQFLCGSSLMATRNLAALIALGEIDLAVAGGVESMSRVGMGSDVLPPPTSLKNMRAVMKMGQKVAKLTMHPKAQITPMNISAALIAEEYGFTSREMNQFSIESHQKAKKAKEEGKFSTEIVPIETGRGKVEDSDDGIKEFNHSAFSRMFPPRWGNVSAGNCSQEMDGAAALLLASQDALNEYGLEPRAKIVASAVSATINGDPKLQLTATVDAMEKVVKSVQIATGDEKFSLQDIDLFEINEAFAPVVLATQEDTGIPSSKINVNGGAIALGHPLGASGTRLITTLLHELEAQDKRYGLVVLCVGGGQAIAMIIDRKDL